MLKQKRFIVIFLLAAIFIGAPYYLLGDAVISNPISTRSLRSVFDQQSAVFLGPITSLGIVGTPTKTFQCLDDHTTYLATHYICLDSYTYPNSTEPISSTAQTNYPMNATKFDTLLKQNGWVNDRPNDSVTTVANSNPYLAQNGGVGAEVPFHKNVGTISCNLEIDFNSLSDEMSPGTINVNTFSCEQHLRLFMPHVSQAQEGGI